MLAVQKARGSERVANKPTLAGVALAEGWQSCEGTKPGGPEPPSGGAPLLQGRRRRPPDWSRFAAQNEGYARSEVEAHSLGWESLARSAALVVA